MKQLFYRLSLLLITTIALTCCNKPVIDDDPIPEPEPSTAFCDCLTFDEIDKSIPIMNAYLATLPNEITREYVLTSLKEWLEEMPCDINLHCSYANTGLERQLVAIAINVQDEAHERLYYIVFPLNDDNQIDYSQIDGYLFGREDVIYVSVLYGAIDSVFSFINTTSLEVKGILYNTFLSSMTADRDTLNYIINSIKAKPYTDDTWVRGNLYGYGANIVIHANLYEIHNIAYQADWLATMEAFSMVSHAYNRSHLIQFCIPEWSYDTWSAYFNADPLVRWTEKGYTTQFVR